MAENTSGNNKPGILAKAQKRIARTKTKVLQNLGKAEKTTDDIVNDYVTKVDKQQETGQHLQKELKNYVHCVRNLCQASKGLHACLSQTYEDDWTEEPLFMEQMKALDLLWSDYAQNIQESSNSIQTYLHSFPTLKNKVAKRGRKMVDFDNARHHIEVLQGAKKRDEVKIQKAQEDLNEAKRIYEQMNNELHTELPEFYNSRVSYYASLFTNVFGTEFVFHSEMGKMYGTVGDISQKLAKDYEQFVYQPKSSLHKSISANSTGELGVNGDSSSTPSTPVVSGPHTSGPSRDSSEPVYHNQDILDASQPSGQSLYRESKETLASTTIIEQAQGQRSQQTPQAIESKCSMFSTSSSSSSVSTGLGSPKIGFLKSLKRKMSFKSKTPLSTNISLEMIKTSESLIGGTLASLTQKYKCPYFFQNSIIEEEPSTKDCPSDKREVDKLVVEKDERVSCPSEQREVDKSVVIAVSGDSQGETGSPGQSISKYHRNDEERLCDKGGTFREGMNCADDHTNEFFDLSVDLYKGQVRSSQDIACSQCVYEVKGTFSPPPAYQTLSPPMTVSPPHPPKYLLLRQAPPPPPLAPLPPRPPPPISQIFLSKPDQPVTFHPSHNPPSKPDDFPAKDIDPKPSGDVKDEITLPLNVKEIPNARDPMLKIHPHASQDNKVSINLQLLPSVKRPKSPSVSWNKEDKVLLPNRIQRKGMMPESGTNEKDEDAGLNYTSISGDKKLAVDQPSKPDSQSYYQTAFFKQSDLRDENESPKHFQPETLDTNLKTETLSIETQLNTSKIETAMVIPHSNNKYPKPMTTLLTTKSGSEKQTQDMSSIQNNEPTIFKGKKSLSNFLEQHLKKKHALPSVKADDEPPEDLFNGSMNGKLEKISENENKSLGCHETQFGNNKSRSSFEETNGENRCLKETEKINKLTSQEDLPYMSEVNDASTVNPFHLHHQRQIEPEAVCQGDEQTDTGFYDLKQGNVITNEVLSLSPGINGLGIKTVVIVDPGTECFGQLNGFKNRQQEVQSLSGQNSQAVCHSSVAKDDEDGKERESPPVDDEKKEVEEKLKDSPPETSDSSKRYYQFERTMSWSFGSLVDIIIPDSFLKLATQTKLLVDKCVPSVTQLTRSLSDGMPPNFTDQDVNSILNPYGSSVDSVDTTNPRHSVLIGNMFPVDVSLNEIKGLTSDDLTGAPVTRMEWEAKRQSILEPALENSSPKFPANVPFGNSLQQVSLEPGHVQDTGTESTEVVSKVFQNVLTDIVSVGSSSLRKNFKDKTVPLWKIGKQRNWNEYSSAGESKSCMEQPSKDTRFHVHDAMLSRLQMSVPILHLEREHKMPHKARHSQDSLDRYGSWDSTLSGECSVEYLDAVDCRLDTSSSGAEDGKSIQAVSKDIDKGDKPTKSLQESLALRRSLLTDDEEMTSSSSQEESD